MTTMPQVITHTNIDFMLLDVKTNEFPTHPGCVVRHQRLTRLGIGIVIGMSKNEAKVLWSNGVMLKPTGKGFISPSVNVEPPMFLPSADTKVVTLESK